MKNKKSKKKQFIIRNLINDDIFLMEDESEALQVAIKENKKSECNPRFDLYYASNSGKSKVIAYLAREFGTDKFFWNFIKDVRDL